MAVGEDAVEVAKEQPGDLLEAATPALLGRKSAEKDESFLTTLAKGGKRRAGIIA